KTTSEVMESMAQQGLRKKNVIEDGLPYLEFAGTVIYSREKNDCSFLTEDLRSSLTPGSAVGFDMEWPPSFAKGETKKVALIQLCVSEDKCYLFHISSMSGFPSGLKMLLQDENIRKVGIGIEGDMWKLLSDFDVKLNNFLELTNLANEKLRCVEQWSLDGLVKHLFNKQLKKDKDVRCSQWNDFSLTEDQKRYAATDAYVKDMTVKVGTLRHSLMAYKHKQCTTNVVVDRQNLSEKKTLIPHSTAAIHQGSSDSEDVDHSSTDLMVPGGVSDVVEEVTKIKDYNTNLRKCIMSLDISEYELQMLEMQARQEDLVEQSTLEFQVCVFLLHSSFSAIHFTVHKSSDSAAELFSYIVLYFLICNKGAFFPLQDQQTLNNSSDISCIIESDEELDNEMLQVTYNGKFGLSQLLLLFVLILIRISTVIILLTTLSSVMEHWFTAFNFVPFPLFHTDPSIPVPNSEEIKCLKKYFGHSSFKPVQWKVIYSVLNERRDNLVVMATGYGKSLCFQFPPVYCGGISVVISPLIALMEDQVLQLRMSNIPACFLGSAQNENILANVKQGHYRVVYMTPEFCTGTIWLLEQLNNSVGLSLVAIDEAHCISEWGHDFRGAYRNLGNLRRTLGKVPILALTATASPSVREDIVKSLKLINPVVTCTSFDRPNIFLDVHYKSGNALQDLKQFLVKKGEYEFEGPTIVYCPSRKEAERVSAELYKLGILCGVYHAGLGVKQRRETQHRFMRDEIQCMVATVAFGMGINKADIRKVIHYGAPKEMESYYQEIGRAGRDGLPSACHVLWASGDMVLNRFLLNKVRNDRFRGYKIKMMAKMEQYLKSQRCRRKIILSHFEDKQLRKATSGIIGTSDCCDNCRAMLSYGREDSEPVLQDFGKEAYQLMTAVSVLDERFGITVPILFLRGSGSQRLPDLYRKHTLFGAGRSVSEAWWKALARKLIGEEYLTESMGQSRFATLCKLTPKGRKWLSKSKCETQCSLFLQPDSDLTTRIQVSRLSNNTLMISLTIARIVWKVRYRNVRMTFRFLLLSFVLQEELYAKLVTGRQKLASEKDIPPAILATNKILLDMAKFKPCTVTSLRQVEGVSEAKSRMLEPLLQIITEFCHTHGLQVGLSFLSSTSLCTERTGLVVSATSLPDSVAVTYRLFQEEGKSLRQVCDQRSLPLAVVESHLLQSFRAGCPLDTERAGLSALNRATITRIITSHPINSGKGLYCNRLLVSLKDNKRKTKMCNHRHSV
uniref:DNA 3'-5' helicase n=1 Tax=Scleropages formosus TaxID=113540 RepID=A0A8C9TWQ0_SCLFO